MLLSLYAQSGEFKPNVFRFTHRYVLPVARYQLLPISVCLNAFYKFSQPISNWIAHPGKGFTVKPQTFSPKYAVFRNEFLQDSSREWLNSLRPRQNGRHFAGDAFKRIFLNQNVRILIEISLQFVPKGPINKISSLFQIKTSHRPDDKPLSEPMMVSSLTHICVARPQWVNVQDPLSLALMPKRASKYHYEMGDGLLIHSQSRPRWSNWSLEMVK